MNNTQEANALRFFSLCIVPRSVGHVKTCRTPQFLLKVSVGLLEAGAGVLSFPMLCFDLSSHVFFSCLCLSVYLFRSDNDHS